MWIAKKEFILRRDEYRCRVCFWTEDLNVHHILYFGKPWEVSDGALITLCKTCHEKAHEIYKGNGNTSSYIKGGKPSKVDEICAMNLHSFVELIPPAGVGKGELVQILESWLSGQKFDVSRETCKRAVSRMVEIGRLVVCQVDANTRVFNRGFV